AVLLEPDEIVQIDVVQIEFEVMIVIVQVVDENGNNNQRSVHATIDRVNYAKYLRIHVSARLKKTQLLIRSQCKSGADLAIRHNYIPVVDQQINQDPRQILPDETAHVGVIDHVVSDAQTEHDSGILVARCVADPEVRLPSQGVVIDSVAGFLLLNPGSIR